MNAVEFQTKLKEDGSIDVPEVYRGQMQGILRVIILSEEPGEKASLLEELLKTPRRVEPFMPVKRDELYDRS